MEKKLLHNIAYVTVRENVGMLIKQQMPPHGLPMTQEERKKNSSFRVKNKKIILE